MKYFRWSFIGVCLFVVVGCATMQDSWEKAQSTDTVAAYRGFLKEYPESKFKGRALERIMRLEWKSARSKDTIAAYEGFLKEYPESELKDKARARIKDIQEIDTLRAKFKARLLQWEKDAPEYVKHDITVLRTSMDPVARGYAAIRLGNAGSRAKGAILALIETFGDDASLEWIIGEKPNTFIGAPTSPAQEAENALVKIGDPAVEPLIEALKVENSGGRAVAADVLGRLEEPRAVGPLIEALKDKDAGVRGHAADALGRLKASRAVGPLIEALKDKDAGVRMHAAYALEAIKDPRAIGPLIEALKDWDSDVRDGAMDALGKIDPHWPSSKTAKDAVPGFIAALKNGDWERREDVVNALGAIKDPRAIGPLIEALKDKNSRVREDVVDALGKIDPHWPSGKAAKDAVPGFIDELKDKDSNVRQGAANALGAIKDPRAIGPLIEALKDKDWYMMYVLGKMDPHWPSSKAAKDAVPDFVGELKDKDLNVREDAAHVLGAMKDPRAIGPLIEALDDWYPDVRQAVADALGKIDPHWPSSKTAKDAVPGFIAELKDKNSRGHDGAAGALGAIKDPRAVEPLIDVLKDWNSNIREDAANALGAIKDPRAIGPLIAALKDEDSSVRIYAANALEAITGMGFGTDYQKWAGWRHASK